MSEGGIEDLQELFNGEEHWLQFGQDIHVPYLKVHEEVKLLAWVAKGGKQPRVVDRFDSAEAIAYVTVEAPELERAWHPEEQAWGNFAIMLQAIARLLPEGRRALVTEQYVTRDSKWNVTAVDYRVLWKGEPL